MIVALGAVLGMLGGLATASPALAGRGPKWEFAEARPFTLPAAPFCGFRVRVAFPVNKEFIKGLKAADGSMISLITGSFKVSLTNLSTGTTITVNASGSGKFTAHADGSTTDVTRGHSLNFLGAADAQRFGLPAVSVTTGKEVSTVDAHGNLTSLTLNGHVLVDVCAALS